MSVTTSNGAAKVVAAKTKVNNLNIHKNKENSQSVALNGRESKRKQKKDGTSHKKMSTK